MALISKERILKHWDSFSLPKKVEKIRLLGYEINGGLSITYEMKCQIFLLDNQHLKGETIVIILTKNKNKMKRNLAILDVETGGFSTEKNGVCEIALLIVNPETLEVVEEYSTLIKPYTRADDTDELVSYKEDAMAVHGITIEELENEGVEVTEALMGTMILLDRNDVQIIAGHNVKTFDVKKVEHLLKRFLQVDLELYEKYCTLEASRKHLNAKSNKLEDLCVEFKIEQKEAHRALNDCYNTLGLMRVLKEKGVLEI